MRALPWTLILFTTLTPAWSQTPPPAEPVVTDELAADRAAHEAEADITAEELADHDSRAPVSLAGRIGFGGSERGYQSDFGFRLQGPLLGPNGSRESTAAELRAPTNNERIELNVAAGLPSVRARLMVEGRDIDYFPGFSFDEGVRGRVRMVFNPLVLRGILTGSADGPSQHYGAYEPRTGMTGELTVPLWGAAELRSRLGAAVALALGVAVDGDGTAGVAALLGRLEGGIELDFGADDWRIFSDFIFQESMPYLTNLATLRAFQFNVGLRGPTPVPGLNFTAAFNMREERADVRSGLTDSEGVEVVRDAGNANFIGGSVGVVFE